MSLLLMSFVSMGGCKVVELPFNRTEILGTCLFSYCALEEEDKFTLLLDGTVVRDCRENPLRCLLL